jgi:hypothetical protein
MCWRNLLRVLLGCNVKLIVGSIVGSRVGESSEIVDTTTINENNNKLITNEKKGSFLT